VHDTAEQLIRSSDLVVFATVAGQPHVDDPSLFADDPVVLHVSRRDLAPEIMLGSTNIVDDIEHCLKADTSAHLAEQLTGNRDFVAGTLDDVMTGRMRVPADRPVVFSPFGLGVLHLAVASTSTTRWTGPASCTSSTTSSTSSADTDERLRLVGENKPIALQHRPRTHPNPTNREPDDHGRAGAGGAGTVSPAGPPARRGRAGTGHHGGRRGHRAHDRP
jgi:hypothetical protein